jgi:8-amino-7-oxononanoate synthase
MRDFTSSLYLGMAHPSSRLPGWSALTTGRPAALGRPRLEDAVCRRLARLTGTSAAVLRHSSLHGLADCLEVLAGRSGVVHVDRGLYAIGRWAVERARGRGATIACFDHHDPEALAASLRRHPARTRPVVVADGFCVGCGSQLPLADYLEVGRHHAVLLLVDDTQALGILGADPAPAGGLGRGGGGILPSTGVHGDDVVLVSSLAKGFGVPVAAVCGPGALIGRVAVAGGSALHASPPSIVDVLAARAALDQNLSEGDRLRNVLSARISGLRAAARASGLALSGAVFPVQSTPPAPVRHSLRVRDRLLAAGVRAIPTASCPPGATSVTLVVTTDHSARDVAEAGSLLGELWHLATVPDERAG